MKHYHSNGSFQVSAEFQNMRYRKSINSQRKLPVWEYLLLAFIAATINYMQTHELELFIWQHLQAAILNVLMFPWKSILARTLFICLIIHNMDDVNEILKLKKRPQPLKLLPFKDTLNDWNVADRNGKIMGINVCGVHISPGQTST